MQTLYTGLTELKQAGFHVILIGHLARKYREMDGSLNDEGLRVMADENIAYEADAILLVEREGDERAITPIIKPPRPAHLKLNKRYPAQLSVLYPDLVPDESKTSSRKSDKANARKAEPEVTEKLAADEIEADDGPSVEYAPSQPVPETNRAVSEPPANEPPRDAADAERRFFARYSEVIGGESWGEVQHFLKSRAPKPTTVEGWIRVAEAVRDRARNGSSALAA